MKEYYQNNIIEFATIHLEKPYVWGEIGPDTFDSGGFTYYIFQELFRIDINDTGYGLDNTTKQMTNNIGTLRQYIESDKKKENYLTDIEPGDLLFFHKKSLEDNQPTSSNNYPGHVGIYLGNSSFIHASPEDGKVIISKLDEDWLKTLVASRNLISEFI